MAGGKREGTNYRVRAQGLDTPNLLAHSRSRQESEHRCPVNPESHGTEQPVGRLTSSRKIEGSRSTGEGWNRRISPGQPGEGWSPTELCRGHGLPIATVSLLLGNVHGDAGPLSDNLSPELLRSQCHGLCLRRFGSSRLLE